MTSAENVKKKYNGLLQSLKTERDELKVNIHLASLEVKEEWHEVEEKWDTFKFKLNQLDNEVKHTSHEVGDTLKDLGEEIKGRYRRIKRII